MRRRIVCLLSLLALTSSCATSPGRGPTVGRIDTYASQTKAVIQLSDPQIYSRETLVNDRRQEAEYLLRLLEDSEDQVFEPEVHRSLRLLTATTLRLGATFDPLAGKAAGRQDDLAAIKHRTEVVKAQAELLEAQTALEELIAGDAQTLRRVAAAETASDGAGDAGGGDAGSADGGGGKDGGKTGGGDDGQALSVPDGKALLDEIATSVTRMLALLDKLPDGGDFDVAASPRDVFRDRQAYRSELRAALAEVELDDSHDRGQNSLYRLQFRATVLPGEHTDRFAVARLRLRRPELSKTDVVELYKTWLTHVTARLNQTESGAIVADPSYLMLGTGVEARSLFRIITLPLDEPSTADTPAVVRLALPPEVAEILRPYVDGVQSPAQLQGFERRLKQLAVDLAALLKCADQEDFRLIHRKNYCEPQELERARGGDCGDWSEVADGFYMADDLYWPQEYFASALRGIVPRGRLPESRRKSLQKLLDDTADIAERVQRLIDLWKKAHPDNADCFTEGDGFQYLPPRLVEALAVSDRPWSDQERGEAVDGEAAAEGTAAREEAAGDVFVYATAPSELTQRLATNAGANRSFEMALALGANLATSGVAAEAGFGQLRGLQSEIEALERVPLVVGFADRALPRGNEDVGPPEFGWIFGPRAQIDGADLTWSQPVTSYVVTADVSVPGWWPWIGLEQESAWVGNWWRSGEMLRPERWWRGDGIHSEHFKVHLPLNSADLDSLTAYLAKKTAGGTLPATRITAVTPDTIAFCREEVTFLVHGTNIWRGTEAFLNGQRHAELRILPDMAGLAVKFAGLRNLPRLGGDSTTALLTLWSREGTATQEVKVMDGRHAGLRCGGDGAPPLRLQVATGRIVGTSGDLKLVAREGRLPKRFHHLAVRVRPVRFAAPWSVAQEPPRTATVDPQGAWASGQVEFEDAFDGLESGDLLEIVLEERPSPHDLAVYHACDGRVVYYAGDSDARAVLQTRTLPDLQQPVKIQLPTRYDIAYPGLRNAALVGRVQGKPALEVRARSLRWPDPAKPNPILEATLEVIGKELAGGDVIELELKGSDLPRLEPRAIVVAKGPDESKAPAASSSR